MDSLSLALFITYLHQRGYATATIRTIVAGVSYHHKSIGLPDPASSFIIAKAFQGIQKLNPSMDKRQPISLDLLHKLCDALDTFNLPTYEQKLFRTMFLCAFYGLCRISELTGKPENHTLLATDVVVHAKQTKCFLTFRTYKHSKGSQSVTIYQQATSQYCPVRAMIAYISLRPSETTYLFSTSNGQPVPRLLFSYMLKKCLLKYNLNTRYYTSHSFRIGGATLAARIGMPSLVIQHLGRWRSSAFLKYIRL